MSYSNHLIALSDIDCMTVIRALSIFIQDEYTHEFDKNIAENVRQRIYEKVGADKNDFKPKTNTRKYTTCSDCKWLDKTQKKSIGYKCVNPSRKWRSKTAQFHNPSCKSCKCGFELKE